MLEISAVGRRLPQGPAAINQGTAATLLLTRIPVAGMCLWLPPNPRFLPFQPECTRPTPRSQFLVGFLAMPDYFITIPPPPCEISSQHKRGEISLRGHIYFIKITHPSICPHTAPCCVGYWRSLATPRHSSEGPNLFNPCTSGWNGPLHSFRNLWRFDMFPCFTPSIFGTA